MQNVEGRAPGLPMGRVLGVPVYVSRHWPLVAIVITIWFYPHAADVVTGPAAVLVAFSYAVLLYASVFLHELGHALTARAFGLPVRAIILYVLGGVTQLDRESRSPGRSFLVAAAGPAVSLVLGGLGLLLLRTADLPPVPHLLVEVLAIANLLVGVFNLLPGLPLDGGFLVRAAVWKLSGHDRTGTIFAARLGRALAVLILLGGTFFSSRMPGREGTDWFLVAWTAFIASFIWIGATQSIAAERMRDRIPLLHARRLGRRAAAVSSEMPLAQALVTARDAGAGALVIVDHEGRPTGLVSEQAVAAVPESRHPWVTAGEVARGLDADTTLPADISGEDLVIAVRRSRASELLLLEPSGAIYGVLASSDLDRHLTRP